VFPRRTFPRYASGDYQRWVRFKSKWCMYESRFLWLTILTWNRLSAQDLWFLFKSMFLLLKIKTIFWNLWTVDYRTVCSPIVLHLSFWHNAGFCVPCDLFVQHGNFIDFYQFLVILILNQFGATAFDTTYRSPFSRMICDFDSNKKNTEISGVQ